MIREKQILSVCIFKYSFSKWSQFNYRYYILHILNTSRLFWKHDYKTFIWNAIIHYNKYFQFEPFHKIISYLISNIWNKIWIVEPISMHRKLIFLSNIRTRNQRHLQICRLSKPSMRSSHDKTEYPIINPFEHINHTLQSSVTSNVKQIYKYDIFRTTEIKRSNFRIATFAHFFSS